MAHLEFSKEITALLVIDPYNEFISAGPPSIDNRTARITTGLPVTRAGAIDLSLTRIQSHYNFRFTTDLEIRG